MKLHRLRVEHVRGIEQAEVRFDDGVTIIEAPNESGKTTLFDAFELLLQEKATSRKQVIRDLAPAGSDVGSLVEAELTLGSTHVTVRKQFNRAQMTELMQHAPVTRQFAGEEAHNHLQTLLEEHTDLALFHALWLRQGGELDGLGDLTLSEQLAERLDASAGGSGEVADDSLQERILAEFRKYFTDTGRPKQDPLGDADQQCAQIDAQVEQLEADGDALTKLSEQFAFAEAAQQRVRGEIVELEPQVAQHRERRQRIDALRRDLKHAELRRETAAQTLHRANEDRQAREKLVADVDALQQKRNKAADEQQQISDQLTYSDEQQGEAAKLLEVAKQEENEARAVARAARFAANLEAGKAQLVELREQERRVNKALDEGEAAASFLAANPLTDAQHTAIRDAAADLRMFETLLDEAAPTVAVHADGAREIVVDGQPVAVSSRKLTRHVPDELTVTVDEVHLTFRAGASLAERHAEVERARRKLLAACEEVGVKDAAGADELASKREAYARIVDDRDAILTRELRGRTREQLSDEIRRIDAQNDHLADQIDTVGQDSQLELLADRPVGSAETVEACVEAAEAARVKVQRRQDEYDLADQKLQRLRNTATKMRTDAEHVQLQLDQSHERLQQLRKELDDAALADQIVQAQKDFSKHSDAFEDVQTELEQHQPSEVELLADNAEQRLERMKRERDEQREQAQRLRGIIEGKGGLGIGEKLDQARAEQSRIHEYRRSLNARAAAAAVLKEAFEVARDQAYAAYREPLRQRIVQAGKLVFGQDFEVELDEKLSVANRTLGGASLELDKLSAGAREQLSILTAIAVADLAGDDGVPVVLDDTLGHSDPTRLERVGALLGQVRGPQIIVLTCVGSRFRIGDANVVRLAEQPLTTAS